MICEHWCAVGGSRVAALLPLAPPPAVLPPSLAALATAYPPTPPPAHTPWYLLPFTCTLTCYCCSSCYAALPAAPHWAPAASTCCAAAWYLPAFVRWCCLVISNYAAMDCVVRGTQELTIADQPVARPAPQGTPAGLFRCLTRPAFTSGHLQGLGDGSRLAGIVGLHSSAAAAAAAAAAATAEAAGRPAVAFTCA